MAIEPADTSDARLPDDLQFICEQLADDAEHLARTYPANAPRNWRRAFAAAALQQTHPARERARRTRADEEQRLRMMFVGVVAAAVLAIMATGWYSTHRGSQPTGTTPHRSSTAGRPDVEAGRNGAVIRAGVLPALGADSFQSFSLPEQEALIDVLHTNGIPEPHVEY